MERQTGPVDERVEPGQPSMLPDWMRRPPPPKMTLGRRLAALLGRIRWLSWLRERWWAWRARRRLSDRYPTTVKILAVFLAWGASIGLIMIVYSCYAAA